MDASAFDEELKKADLVITGEGTVDRSTWKGKVVGQVVKRAARAGIPVVILAGRLGPGWKPPRARGRLLIEELGRGLPLAESMARVRTLLPEATIRALRQLTTR
jgi:glycerate 2-kinase